MLCSCVFSALHLLPGLVLVPLNLALQASLSRTYRQTVSAMFAAGVPDMSCIPRVGTISSGPCLYGLGLCQMRGVAIKTLGAITSEDSLLILKKQTAVRAESALYERDAKLQMCWSLTDAYCSS